MKKLIYALVFSFLCLGLLLSCSSNLVSSDLFSSEEEDEDSRSSRRTRRLDSRLRDSSEVCSKSQDCMEICDEMYLKAGDLDQCYSARENTVKKTAAVFDELINPKRVRDLNKIDVSDFRTYLNWGIRSFIDLMDQVDRDEDGGRSDEDGADLYGYDESSVDVVLEWICNKEDVQKAIYSQSPADGKMDVVNQLVYERFKSTSSIDEDLSTQDNCNNNTKLTDAQKDELDEICPDICEAEHHDYAWSRAVPCECP